MDSHLDKGFGNKRRVKEITALIVIGALVLVGFIIYFIPNRRRAEIQAILADLESLRFDPYYKEAVALNIEFFKAVRFPISYLGWLIFKAPRIRRNRIRITELGDLPFPRWQKLLLETLSGFEARVTWMLQPIKRKIIMELGRLKETQKGPVVVLSLGCGGMELERQIMYELLRTRLNLPVVFIGVDYSTAVPEVMASRFAPLVSKGLLQVKTISHLDTDVLNKLKIQTTSHMFSVVLLNTSAFDLKDLPENSLSLIYHTRLRHHLTLEESRRLDELAIHLAPKVIELDDLFSIPGFILASIFAWRFPVVLNGGILSYLRDFSKKELLAQKAEAWTVATFSNPVWCHLRVYDKVEAEG